MAQKLTSLLLFLFLTGAAYSQRPAPGTSATPAPAPEIYDLTPRSVVVQEDGIFSTRIAFLAPRSRALLRLPGGWNASGQGSTLFTCKEESRATITFTQSSIPILPLDTPAKLDAIRRAVLVQAPPDAAGTTITAETPAAFPINGWLSHQFNLTYTHFGIRYRKVITFLRLHPRQEIQIVAHTPESFAARTLSAVQELLQSWYREPLPR